MTQIKSERGKLSSESEGLGSTLSPVPADLRPSRELQGGLDGKRYINFRIIQQVGVTDATNLRPLGPPSDRNDTFEDPDIKTIFSTFCGNASLPSWASTASSDQLLAFGTALVAAYNPDFTISGIRVSELQIHPRLHRSLEHMSIEELEKPVFAVEIIIVPVNKPIEPNANGAS